MINITNKLQSSVGEHLEVLINDNRSTMLSVRWDRRKTKVSLHRMFLEAPVDVEDALVSYLRREKKQLPIKIKAFIRERQSALDYSHALDKKALVTKGVHYDLQKVYRKVKDAYFPDAPEVSITWFGTERPKSRTRCSLGVYHDLIKLVKVHRVLDHAHVPEFVVEYIVYHELVHSICPSYIDKKGICRMHGPEFKAIERRFPQFREATLWIKNNQDNFFHPKSGVLTWPVIANGQISSIAKAKPMRSRGKSLLGSLKKLLTP